jgi:cell division protein FtsB
MPNKYFKPHESFDLNPHHYDVGVFTGLKDGYEDNLFIKKLFILPEQEYTDYYQYHLSYFLGKEPQGEHAFFSFVWQIVLRRIRFIENKNPFNSSHALDMEILEKLLHFQKYLRSIDQWNTQKTLPEIIVDQQEEIAKLNAKNNKLKEENKKLRELEPKDFIDIREGRQRTLYHLMLQVRELKLEDGKQLTKATTLNIWCKMIARYFRVDGEQISLQSITRYFGLDDHADHTKYKDISPKDRLFTIVPAKKRSL